MYATGRQRSCQEPDLLGTELPIPPMRLSVRHQVHTALSNQTAAHSANLYTDAGHELSETEYLRLLPPPKRIRVIGRHWAKVNQKGRQCNPFGMRCLSFLLLVSERLCNGRCFLKIPSITTSPCYTGYTGRRILSP